MLNYIWLGMILSAVLVGGFTGRVPQMVTGAVDGAKAAVTLALGLVGIMALWLGVMRLAEKAGLIQSLAKFLRPVLQWLFPDVPAEHPAMGAMLMNVAANMLGLNNAATPLGLRAMKHLETLNPRPGVATNAMCTFLAVNTSAVQLIPMSAVALLAGAQSKNPSAIIGTAFLSTLCAAITGIAAVKFLEKLPAFRLPSLGVSADRPAAPSGPAVDGGADTDGGVVAPTAPKLSWVVLAGFVACFAWFFMDLAVHPPVDRDHPLDAQNSALLVRAINAISFLAIPFLLGFFPLYAAFRRVAVYEEFVEGAKEGFQVALRIIPFLVAMLVAIGLFRSAGIIDLITRALAPVLDRLHFPPELLPISLMRPLSGSASMSLLAELIKQHGPDSLIARTASTLYGSTETTFYVLAVYFGSANIKRTRHAVPAGLLADLAGVIASVTICRLVFG